MALDNLFKGVDGTYVSFDGVIHESEKGVVAEVKSLAPYDRLSIKFNNQNENISLEKPFIVQLYHGNQVYFNTRIQLKVIPEAHVHKWGNVQYEWSQDLKTCTAKRTCILNANHVESETVDVQPSVKIQATCINKGTTEYTARFTAGWAQKQLKCSDDIEMRAHQFDEKWLSDLHQHWHACRACGLKQEESGHAFRWIVDKEASRTEKGSKHEECTVCGYKKANVDIPALTAPAQENPANGVKNPITGIQDQVGVSAIVVLSVLGILALMVLKKDKAGNRE